MLKRLLIMSSLLLTSLAFAKATLHSLHLRHLESQQIIALLAPVLPNNVKVSGHDRLLVIHSSHQDYQRLRRFIERLDQAKPLLTVTLRFATAHPAGHVVNTTRGFRRFSTTPQDGKTRIQRLHVQDGQTAFINQDFAIPLVAGFDVFSLGIRYQAIRQGFIVRPQLAGDQVKLTISQRREMRDRFGENGLHQGNMMTTLTIPLNKWVALGGHDDAAIPDNTLLYSTNDNQLELNTVFIKVAKYDE